MGLTQLWKEKNQCLNLSNTGPKICTDDKGTKEGNSYVYKECFGSLRSLRCLCNLEGTDKLCHRTSVPVTSVSPERVGKDRHTGRFKVKQKRQMFLACFC